MIVSALWYTTTPPLVELHKGDEVFFKPLEFLSHKSLSKGRYCIGYDVGGRYYPCGRQISRGYQCTECRKKDLFAACAMCDGTVCLTANRKALEWCNQPFAVYLAYFGGNVVKVGVSAENRLQERLLEQGAVAYLVLDTAENGLLARRAEKQFSEDLGARMSVRWGEKVKLYGAIDIEWFSENFGDTGDVIILDYNFRHARMLAESRKLDSITVVPRVIGSCGSVILTANQRYFLFSQIKARKIAQAVTLDAYF